MSKHIIALSGYAGSGKDTVASILEPYGYKNYKYATIIYNMLAVMLNTSVEEVAKMKEAEELIPMTECTVRSALQTLGTEWGREKVDKYIWAKMLYKAILDSNEDKIVISDMRFLNEYYSFVDFCVDNDIEYEIVYIERNSAKPQIHHASEQEIKAIKERADTIIENNFDTFLGLGMEVESIFDL